MIAGVGADTFNLQDLFVSEKDPEKGSDTLKGSEEKTEHAWHNCQHLFSLKSAGTLLSTICALPEIVLELIKKIIRTIAALFQARKEESPPKMDPDTLLLTCFKGLDMGETAERIRENLQGKILPITLHIKRKNLREIPPELGRLPLVELDLSENKFKEIPPDILSLAPHLTDLDLSSNMLESVPGWINIFRALTRFNLASNHLQHVLTQKVGTLNLLKYLNVEDNSIEELPDNFDSLLALEELLLDKNELERLPSTLCKCKELKQLLCSRNKLTKLPKNIGALKRLNFLKCSDNQISSLPPSLTTCEDLAYLNLSNNPLSDLPAGFEKLTGLTSLFLANDHLKSLPADFSPPNLAVLDLSGNLFEAFPAVLFKLKELRNLTLDQSQFNKWSAALKRLQDLNPLVKFFSPGTDSQQLFLH